MKELDNNLLDPNKVLQKLTKLKDRPYWWPTNTNENWCNCDKSLQEVLRDKSNIQDDIEFDRCQCMRKQRRYSQAIVCKFFLLKDKPKILQNAMKLKNTGIYIYEDFCNSTMELRKSLWTEVLNHRHQGKFAYLNYRRVVARYDSFFFSFLCILLFQRVIC